MGDGLPERAHCSIVPRLCIPAEVVRPREELESAASGGRRLPFKLLDGGIRVARRLAVPHADEPHETGRISVHCRRQELVEHPELRGLVQHRHVHPCVVHLCNEHLWGTFQVVQQRREVLLRVGLAIVFPDQAADVSCPANVSQPPRFRVDQCVVVGRGPVPHPPHRLVMSAELRLDRPHIVFECGEPLGRVHRREGVGVAVDYHVVVLRAPDRARQATPLPA